MRYIYLILLLLILSTTTYSQGAGTAASIYRTTFAALGTPTNGSVRYCTDCTVNTSPCTGSGTGAFANRVNGAWSCSGATAATGGTVTEVTGTANQINVATGTTTPALTLSSTLIAPGTVTVSVNGALSAPAVKATGTWITGGSATTNKPYFLIEPTGTTSTNWNTSGTGISVNAASGFAGLLADWQVNGVRVGSVSSNGSVAVAATSGFSFTGRGFVLAPSDGVWTLTSTSGLDFGRLQFGCTDATCPALKRVATGLASRLANDSGDAPFSASTGTFSSTLSGADFTSADATPTLSNAGFVTCTALTTVANVITCTVSDQSVKQGLRPFTDGLDFVRSVTPQTFSFSKGTQYYDGGRTRLGLIAQDVQEHLPNAAIPVGNGLVQVDYNAVTAATLDAVKQLLARIEALEAELTTLKTERKQP